MKKPETQLEREGEPNPVERTPVESRQGSRTKVNFVILIVSTIAAVIGLSIILAPTLLR